MGRVLAAETALPVIFYRSLLREFFLTASAVCAVLLAIMVTTQFIRLLGMAAGG
jgi:lipopolysaccharide export LptBFGC system permease protein LptF